MGTSLLAVKFNDGLILYGGYQSTSDIVIFSKLVKDYDDYEDKPCDDCNCKIVEDVIMYSHYGSGFYWTGKACRKCRVVVDKFEPFGDYCGRNKPALFNHGIPDWFMALNEFFD